ncbi:uncharacterized protein LOC109844548 isoform X1 [Asparagus officinalis]|nr:uncharacterized protein LOC109844548 isoform X1 [Asparagus officinalis]
MKYVEEADFGPGPPIHTLYVVGVLDRKIENLGDSCKWISKDTALGLLLEVSKYSDRIGPFVFIGLLHDSTDSEKWKDSLTTLYQEYPPGVMLFPMKSITGEPFHTTNLVVMVPHNVGNNKSESSAYITYGDALLMDPGCCTQSQSELADLVGALPKKLVVFVTHHHYDHIDGLSIVQKYNPDSILLAHKNTMSRIGKGTWSLGYTSISGGEKICIGGQTLEAIFAPGHTDGHLALLHVSTNSLVVGDHCVGHGSAVLDIKGGGNMKDYFLTTYKFLELSPHVLIPMHGRINLWPKRMLCGYIKNRRARELSILKAIESGARTLFDITAKSYANVDTNMWLPASLNVQIHVDHLAQREKLPKDFSMKKFQASCHHLRFLSQWIWIFLMERKDFSLKVYQVTSRLRFLGQWTWRVLEGHKVSAIKVLTVLGIAGLALSLALKCTY